jgi:hypothetical protein
LKAILPQHGDTLDSMLDGLRSDVEKLGASRTKKKLSPVEPDTQELALSGDIMGYDEKHKQAKRKLDEILSAVNKKFNPHFSGVISDEGEGLLDDIVDYIGDLRDEYDIEVDQNDVVPFSLSRDDIDRSSLAYVEGSVLPDGQIYIIHCGSDRANDGGWLCKTVNDFVQYLYSNWGYAEVYNDEEDEDGMEEDEL